jgi:hypothetical protein
MSRHSIVVVLAVIVASVVAAAAVSATGIRVTINLKGGLGARTRKACGITHHDTLYGIGSRIAINGAVQPAPAVFRVKLKAKRCVNGRFTNVWTAGAHEGRGGTYRGVYVARRRGTFFLRANVYVGRRELRSDKRYVLVR